MSSLLQGNTSGKPFCQVDLKLAMTQNARKRRVSYEEAVHYLYGLQKYGIKFGLSKTANLLKAFGNPHRGQTYVHIGGTNGKGSVAAMVEAILIHSGIKVGLYSSPHLVSFTERFRVSGKEIPRERVASLVGELQKALNAGDPPTFFEFATAMGLIHFAREKTDVSVMEVGMGGRLDATNLILPKVCVITNVSLEHQAFLGRRLVEIAREKAGIIKRGVEVVTGATQPSVLQLLEKVCGERRAPLLRLGRHIRIRVRGSKLHYRGLSQELSDLDVGLLGRHQFRNAALALGAIEVLQKKGLPISEEAIRKGLKTPRWPGRMHVVSRKPLLMLDGAHNPAAIGALMKSIARDVPYRRLIAVLGIMADKDISKMLKRVVPASDYVICTRPEYTRAEAPETLAKRAASLWKGGETRPSVKEALRRAMALAGPDDLVLVTGSLYTVGEAMACIDPDTYRPDKIR